MWGKSKREKVTRAQNQNEKLERQAKNAFFEDFKRRLQEKRLREIEAEKEKQLELVFPENTAQLALF